MNRGFDEEGGERLRSMLTANIPPVNEQLERDLWPDMQRRMERHSVSGIDWLLAAAVVVCAIAFPELIPALVYHL